MVLRFTVFSFSALLLFACKPPAGDCEECEAEAKISGKSLFMDQCLSCHGADGKLGNSGAKDLSISKLTPNEIIEVLSEGKGAMPPALELLADPNQMDSVVQFVQSLRK